jgi:hypothetical protein
MLPARTTTSEPADGAGSIVDLVCRLLGHCRNATKTVPARLPVYVLELRGLSYTMYPDL